MYKLGYPDPQSPRAWEVEGSVNWSVEERPEWEGKYSSGNWELRTAERKPWAPWDLILIVPQYHSLNSI